MSGAPPTMGAGMRLAAQAVPMREEEIERARLALAAGASARPAGLSSSPASAAKKAAPSVALPSGKDKAPPSPDAIKAAAADAKKQADAKAKATV